MSTSPTRFVSYARVSTQQQGTSGLGLEAQQAAIAAHLARCGGELVGEFVEVETGKGSNALAKRFSALGLRASSRQPEVSVSSRWTGVGARWKPSLSVSR